MWDGAAPATETRRLCISGVFFSASVPCRSLRDVLKVSLRGRSALLNTAHSSRRMPVRQMEGSSGSGSWSEDSSPITPVSDRSSRRALACFTEFPLTARSSLLMAPSWAMSSICLLMLSHTS